MKTYNLSKEDFDCLMIKVHTEGGSAFVPDNKKLADFLEEQEKNTGILHDTLNEIYDFYKMYIIDDAQKDDMIIKAVGLFYDHILLEYPEIDDGLIINNDISNDADEVLDFMSKENFSFEDLAPLQKLVLRMATKKEK